MNVFASPVFNTFVTTEWRVFFLIGLAIAAWTDYFYDLILNKFTLPLFVAGILSACYAQWVDGQGLVTTLQSCMVAFGLFFPLYLLRVFGGGDVKLLLALATILTPRGVLVYAGWSIAIGAAGSVALLVLHRRVKIFFIEIFHFFRTLCIRELDIEWPHLSLESKAPFGIVLLGAYVVLWLRYL